MTVPTDPETKLLRAEAAAALTAAGFPITAGTLNKLSGPRGGPPYTTFGRRAIYRWADLLAWAQARTTSRVTKGAGR